MVELFFEKAKILEHYPLYGKPVRETQSPFLREVLVSGTELFTKCFQKTK
jgi:hypothetical protein